MSATQYTVDDLQRFDDIVRVEAEKLGMELPVVQFHVVSAEEMYDIAARGLPGRYSHYQFGREYQRQKQEYDKGRARIYELVLNTRPVHAYLLDGNGLVAQLLVIAHVYGHASTFEHSRYFAPADKNILARTRANAERIDRYIGEYGRTRVEDFIDMCEALEYQRPFDQLGKPRSPKGPTWEDKPFDMLFPDETAVRRLKHKADKEAFRVRFPQQPERDLLGFIERYARRLEDWQRDVISIIRSELEYFVPQMRTQILNEAQAVYYHQTIVQKLMAEDETFTTDDFTEFQAMNARILHPYISQVRDGEDETWIACNGSNPYLTGTVLYEEIKRICENPTDDEKERWSHWAGKITWDEKRAELIEAYDNVSLLSEFLSPRVCEKAKLFNTLRTPEQYKKLRVLEEECDLVRQYLVDSQVNRAPVIEVVDADYHNQGELLLVHRDQGVGLDEEYLQGTLPYVVTLWGHAVVIRTISATDEDEPAPVWWRAVHEGKVTRHTSEPSSA